MRAAGFGRLARWSVALAGAAVALAILAFYLRRLSVPLPIFASDECSYLIRALFSEDMAARQPLTAQVNNGVLLSVIRLVDGFGGSVIIHDRVANGAAYLGGLLLFWRFWTVRSPLRDQVFLLILTVGFPYYRFAFSNLPEGLYVGVLALFCVTMAWLYRRRPIAQALVGGALAAALVLTKPHGIAVVSAFAATVALDALISRQFRPAAVRITLFTAAFLVVGNLIQVAAAQPVRDPLTFFVGDFYRHSLSMTPPPNALWLGWISLVSMLAGAALLAGPPIVVGLMDLAARWRRQPRGLSLDGRDLVFTMLLLALLATIAMVTIFAMRVSSDIGQSLLLWGRYFEFFVPMLWVAAAPAMGRIAVEQRRTVGLASAATVLAGIGGLLIAFRAGVVIFPWDSSILSAFFHPDPQRAPMPFTTPYQALALAATLAAAVALALRVRVVQVGVALILALSAISTHLDNAWLGIMVGGRMDLAADIRAIAPTLPRRPEATVMLAPNANDGFLAFVALKGRPRVITGPPGQASAADLAPARMVLVAGPEAPPGDGWIRTYKGLQLSAYRAREADD